jgi:hypothetical protein
MHAVHIPDAPPSCIPGAVESAGSAQDLQQRASNGDWGCIASVNTAPHASLAAPLCSRPFTPSINSRPGTPQAHKPETSSNLDPRRPRTPQPASAASQWMTPLPITPSARTKEGWPAWCVNMLTTRSLPPGGCSPVVSPRTCTRGRSHSAACASEAGSLSSRPCTPSLLLPIAHPEHVRVLASPAAPCCPFRPGTPSWDAWQGGRSSPCSHCNTPTPETNTSHARTRLHHAAVLAELGAALCRRQGMTGS